MTILGLDTSTRAGSVALVADGRVLGSIEVAGSLDHSTRLLPSVEFLLDRLGLKLAELDGFAVTHGPGSFTGVRVGLATARGLARSVGKPVVGVTSLQALAASHRPPGGGLWVCPWIDAGRGEVYAAAYAGSGDELEERLPPTVGAPERWLERLGENRARFVGDGAETYRALLESRRGVDSICGRGPWFLAQATARIGERLLLEGGGAGWLEPLYLRPSDAEAALRRRA
jgi:tRNA threonylcarbamoyladenosine biosynthesis protein TsaB